MNRFITPGKFKQLNASILAPENAGLRIILNPCGQNGKFDSSLDAILAKRWSKVRENYKEWYANQHDFKMGFLNSAAVASDTWVVNMLVKNKEDKVDDKALQLAIKKVGELAKYEKASVHVSDITVEEMPAIKDLLQKLLSEEGVNVYFYKEPVK